jgi:hypothetical protein
MPEERNRYIHQALIGTPGNPTQDVLTVQYAEGEALTVPTGAATSANQSTLLTRVGEVQASPTPNTILDRLKAIVTALGSVTLSSESGFLTYRNTALTNTAVAVKASAGSVMGWNFINANTVPVYVKFYNIAAASVTVGTSAVLLTIAVPPGSATSPGIFFLEPGLIPVEVFSTAIAMACVTGLADNNNTAPSTAIHVSVRYK